MLALAGAACGEVAVAHDEFTLVNSVSIAEARESLTADSTHAATLVRRLPNATQGPLWPPSDIVDRNGDYVLVGNVLKNVSKKASRERSSQYRPLACWFRDTRRHRATATEEKIFSIPLERAGVPVFGSAVDSGTYFNTLFQFGLPTEENPFGLSIS